jgi:hypothetical protein
MSLIDRFRHKPIFLKPKPDGLPVWHRVVAARTGQVMREIHKTVIRHMPASRYRGFKNNAYVLPLSQYTLMALASITFFRKA